MDEDNIEKESQWILYYIIGRVMYQKGDKPFTTSEIKTKLVVLWKIANFNISHIGRGFYHVFLRNVDYQSKDMCMGTLSLKLGYFIVSRWVKNFNHHNKKQTKCAVLGSYFLSSNGVQR